VGPHVSTRLELYNLHWSLPKDTDYILFPKTIGGEEERRVLRALESKKYGVVDQKGPFVLLGRGRPSGRNRSVIATLKRN
jgi:hypothetical protein